MQRQAAASLSLALFSFFLWSSALCAGYAGFVRGKQFAHGQTFAKTTRDLLDVPLDLPTDID